MTSTLLQEDERKEKELLQKQKEEQLRIDEELAKSLFENDQDTVAVVSKIWAILLTLYFS